MRAIERPDPAALEELVGGGEDRPGLMQLPAEAEREVERRGVAAAVVVRGVAARPGRARRGAGEVVAIAAGEEVAATHGRRRSWAARRAWHHHRHHHLHFLPCYLFPLPAPPSSSTRRSRYKLPPSPPAAGDRRLPRLPFGSVVRLVSSAAPASPRRRVERRHVPRPPLPAASGKKR